MQEKVEEFLTAMVSMGLNQGQANEKTYDYALALLLEQESIGSHVTAAMMEKAVELVREAWTNRPLKYYLQEVKDRMR